MTQIEPCPICGSEPEIDFGLEDAPHIEQFISCPTVHIRGDVIASCPVYADSREAWALICSVARKTQSKEPKG